MDIDGFSPQGFPFTRQHRAQAWYGNAPEVAAIRAVIYVLCGEGGCEEGHQSHVTVDETLCISGKALYERFRQARGLGDKDAINYERFREVVCKTFTCKYTRINRLRGKGAANLRGFGIQYTSIEGAIQKHVDKNYASGRTAALHGTTTYFYEDGSSRATRLEYILRWYEALAGNM